MGFGTHQFGWMPFTGARSLSGDRATLKWWLWGEDQGADADWTTSALDAKSLKSLVEAGQLSTAIDQPLLSAGPGRMRFRVDVQPQCVPRLSVGRARLVRAAVRHHDGYLMIFRVDSFFHRTVLRTAAAYSEAIPHAQCRRDLGVGYPHCEGNQVENIDEPGDIMVAHEPISTRLAAQISLQDLQEPLEPGPMQAQPALQRIGDYAGKGGQHGAAIRRRSRGGAARGTAPAETDCTTRRRDWRRAERLRSPSVARSSP